MKRELETIANTVRKDIILMSYKSKSAHLGGSLSCVDILVALYFSVMKIYPKKPLHPLRDRFILSKAHDVKALYAVLAAKGFFPKSYLDEFEKDNAILPGHSIRHIVPGIEISAGSLGHGLSIASGIAYAAKSDKKSFTVYTLLSDGECQEGSTWEAFLFAGHHKLNNLVAIIDYNKLQGFGRVNDILRLEPFSHKLIDFGWDITEVNGHNIPELLKAFKAATLRKKKPQIILAHTIKGYKGVPKYQNKVASHYKPPTLEEAQKAIEKLNKQ